MRRAFYCRMKRTVMPAQKTAFEKNVWVILLTRSDLRQLLEKGEGLLGW
jgi:hypothetical protein